jgi:nitroimidazol reductase NimA-like FMN-containing flavoprotein (pyridoxamine 5'-phosphate oxidase superfamily)
MPDRPIRARDGAPPATDRVRVRRLPERGRYDRKTIDAILDTSVVGHVGYVVDGQPFVTPTAIWRHGDRLYWHGSSASRMLRVTRDGVLVCVTTTHLDALVLARSGFHHSVDYRSVMVLGLAFELTDADERLQQMEVFVERLYPGRWAELRPPSRKELKATSILWTDLTEASAKVREGGPLDEPGDESWPTWAGTIPVVTSITAPEPDEFGPDGTAAPALSTLLFRD